MPLARAAMAVFGVGALVVGAAALTDAVVHGRLMAFSPLVLGALALLGVLILFVGLIDARQRAQTLQARTAELRSLTEKLWYTASRDPSLPVLLKYPCQPWRQSEYSASYCPGSLAGST